MKEECAEHKEYQLAEKMGAGCEGCFLRMGRHVLFCALVVLCVNYMRAGCARMASAMADMNRIQETMESLAGALHGYPVLDLTYTVLEARRVVCAGPDLHLLRVSVEDDFKEKVEILPVLDETASEFCRDLLRRNLNDTSALPDKGTASRFDMIYGNVYVFTGMDGKTLFLILEDF